MYGHADYIDTDTLERAEREAMVRPSNSAMWDDRLYVTHAPIMGWAERGDDTLSESNYLSALEMIQGAIAHADADADDVIDATISDWLVGSLRQLFVRVRAEDGTFSAAWIEAVRIGLSLQDYPVLDEDDYSQRESRDFDAALTDALADAQRSYGDDTTEDEAEIGERFYRAVCEGALSAWHADELSWDEVATAYADARNSYFAELGHAHLHAQLAGQLTLSL